MHGGPLRYRRTRKTSLLARPPPQARIFASQSHTHTRPRPPSTRRPPSRSRARTRLLPPKRCLPQQELRRLSILGSRRSGTRAQPHQARFIARGQASARIGVCDNVSKIPGAFEEYSGATLARSSLPVVPIGACRSFNHQSKLPSRGSPGPLSISRSFVRSIPLIVYSPGLFTSVARFLGRPAPLSFISRQSVVQTT